MKEGKMIGLKMLSTMNLDGACYNKFKLCYTDFILSYIR